MATEARQQTPAGAGPFDALALRARLAEGSLDAVDLAEACLARIREAEPEVEAWQFLDPDQVLRQARRLDDHRRSGRPLGPLHGLPVAVKDIIDTADMPTGNGTPLDEGRRTLRDAAVVARLRAAGALVMGKTVTTEFAYFSPNKTRNPHDPGRTPGGSSSGSAAAVAAGMVPLALGTQTAGSVIRPAAYCGVFGFKPTHGLIPRTGILKLAPELDTVGTFAQTLEGVALLAETLQGHDPGDPDSAPQAAHRLVEECRSDPPLTPRIAFVRQPAWDQAEESTGEAFAELVEALGPNCEEVALPGIFAEGMAAQQTLMLTGMAKNLASYHQRGADRLSAKARAAIEEGRAITAVDYLRARDWRQALNSGLEALWERFDAIVTPAAAGEAPLGLDATGDPAFCRLWTLCGTPALSLPLMTGPAGMPLGVQLVGERGRDGRLLRTARWLIGHLEEARTE